MNNKMATRLNIFLRAAVFVSVLHFCKATYSHTVKEHFFKPVDMVECSSSERGGKLQDTPDSCKNERDETGSKENARNSFMEDSIKNIPAPAHKVSEQVPDGKDSKWKFKTNLPFWGFLWMNVAAEYQIADHWSTDWSIYYNPVRYVRTFTLKAFMFQPSIRYWLRPCMEGHYFGLHLVTSVYNVSVDNETRYQDLDYPLLGMGIDYGYALQFNHHWGMDFNIGVGYFHTHYETFYNIENGSRISSGFYNYFGITRAGISLIYKL